MTKAVYDLDVHNAWASTAELIEYLPRRWHPYFLGTGAMRAFATPVPTYSRPGGRTDRLDAVPAGGGAPGSDYDLMCEQLLDRHKITRALLTFPAYAEPGYPNSELAIAMCRAANDWMADRWLARGDDRLYAVGMVPTGEPSAAAEEIYRVARNPRISALLLAANALGRPLGHRVHDPIYAAAAEVGLPVMAHVGLDLGVLGAAYATGLPTARADHFGLLDQGPAHHIASMISGGVFERFPTLKLIFDECGFAWLPNVLWRLDALYPVLKVESPGLQRRPSEYFRDHVWVSSQPFDCEADPRQVIELLEAFGGMEDRICFSSDYPHHDSEGPGEVAGRLPAAWRPKVMWQNAATLLGWPSEAPQGASLSTTGTAS